MAAEHDVSYRSGFGQRLLHDKHRLRERKDAAAVVAVDVLIVCDWKTPLAADVLLSRHYPGDGIIDFASLTRAVGATGYDRDIEVEIFNEEIWATEPLEAVRRTAAGFAAAVSPHLLESRS